MTGVQPVSYTHLDVYKRQTHEIDAALYLADEIHVMQNGKLIESRQWNGDLKIFQNPYTKQLLRASHLI